jgi:hypothetical protein
MRRFGSSIPPHASPSFPCSTEDAQRYADLGPLYAGGDLAVSTWAENVNFLNDVLSNRSEQSRAALPSSADKPTADFLEVDFMHFKFSQYLPPTKPFKYKFSQHSPTILAFSIVIMHPLLWPKYVGVRSMNWAMGGKPLSMSLASCNV